MQRRFFIRLVVLCLAVAVGRMAVAGPVIGNIRASQRPDNSGIVDVYYDLSGGAGPMKVDLFFSSNNGAAWNIIPLQNLLQGDFGASITNGTNRHIQWDAFRQFPEVSWQQTRAKVRAAEVGQTITIMLPGGVPLEMVKIPAGTFMMGSGLGGDADEFPQHVVTINYDFWMGKYELTQEQWYSVVGNNPSFNIGPKNPVERVAWEDCQGFISGLNALGAGVFRLPSEAEWEYACRAGSNQKWYFGDNESALGENAWYAGNSRNVFWPDGYCAHWTYYYTETGGQKGPNAFGLYDMLGNVNECCQDNYHSTYVGAPSDGSAWIDSVTDGDRVFRGGTAAAYVGPDCYCAARGHKLFNDRDICNAFAYDGLRVVLCAP